MADRITNGPRLQSAGGWKQVCGNELSAPNGGVVRFFDARKSCDKDNCTRRIAGTGKKNMETVLDALRALTAPEPVGERPTANDDRGDAIGLRAALTALDPLRDDGRIGMLAYQRVSDALRALPRIPLPEPVGEKAIGEREDWEPGGALGILSDLLVALNNKNAADAAGGNEVCDDAVLRCRMRGADCIQRARAQEKPHD